MELTKIEDLGNKTLYKFRDLFFDEKESYVLAKIQEESSWMSLDITKISSLELDDHLIEMYIKIALDNFVIAKQHFYVINSNFLKPFPENTYIREISHDKYAYCIELTDEEYKKILEVLNANG